MRVLFLLVLAVVVGTLFLTSRQRQSTSADKHAAQDFYHKTVNGISDRRGRHPHAPPPPSSPPPPTADHDDQAHRDKQAKEKAEQQHQHVLTDTSASGAEEEDAVVDRDDDGDVDEDDARLAREMQGRLRQAEQQAKDLANAKAPLKPDPPSEVVGKGNSAAGQAPAPPPSQKKEDAKEKPVKQEVDEEEELEEKIEAELNSIFKKSPGMSLPPISLRTQASNTDLPSTSCHLLQDVLPVL